MPTYCRGDIGKIAALILLIVATFWLSFRTIGGVRARRPPARDHITAGASPHRAGPVPLIPQPLGYALGRSVAELDLCSACRL